MSFLLSCRRLFSLETLDLRFVTSPKDPLPGPSERDRVSSPNAAANGTPPPLWRTPEFGFYYLVFIVCVPLMFKSVYDVSQREYLFSANGSF